jgi:hypothetical protein
VDGGSRVLSIICGINFRYYSYTVAAGVCSLQSLSPTVIENPDLDEMGQKELSGLIEKLTGRVTALEKRRLSGTSNAPKGKWDKTFALSLAALIVAVVGLPIMLVSWIEPHLQNDLKSNVKNEVTDQLREPLTQIGEIAGDVKEIKGILATLGVHTFASLPDSQLQAGLVQLKNAVAVAEQQKVKLSPAILKDVQQKLLKVDQNSPDYWPTVLRFIQLASYSLSADVPPPGRPPTVKVSGNIGFGIVIPKVSHAVVLLDGGYLGGDGLTQFDHSRIIFTEQPVHMMNVLFTDCVFEMPISATPNRYLQDAGRVLLTSDLKSAKIPAL